MQAMINTRRASCTHCEAAPFDSHVLDPRCPVLWLQSIRFHIASLVFDDEGSMWCLSMSDESWLADQPAGKAGRTLTMPDSTDPLVLPTEAALGAIRGAFGAEAIEPAWSFVHGKWSIWTQSLSLDTAETRAMPPSF